MSTPEAYEALRLSVVDLGKAISILSSKIDLVADNKVNRDLLDVVGKNNAAIATLLQVYEHERDEQRKRLERIESKIGIGKKA